MNKLFLRVKNYTVAHKIYSSIFFIILSVSSYYGYGYFFGESTETRYILADVERGTLITSVSGTGQVSSYNQVDIKPKASGDIIWLDMKVGQTVYAGQALASIDSADAKKAVADAELALEEANLSFDKDFAQAPIDYERKLESLESLKSDLEKKYEDSFNTVSNAFLDLPSVITGIQNILYGGDMNPISKETNNTAFRNLFSGSDRELIGSLTDIAEKDYKLARDSYDASFNNFKNLTRYSERKAIEEMLDQTLTTTKLMAQSAKSENNLLDTIIDINEKNSIKTNTAITTFKSNIKSYLSTTNNHLSSLLTQKSSLNDLKLSIIDMDRDIEIMKINNPTGSNPINLQISLNSIKKKEVSLADLKAKLADYTIRAPFDGVIAKVNIKKGDSVSSGSAVFTIVTKQKIAEISLNEVDVSNIKLGQKATLTFDAVEDLSISGKVSEIDTLGTASQGVVNYNLKISFDTQDDRIKPGMSVSVSIMTQVKPDVLIVPSSAIKTQNDISYVELFEGGLSKGSTTPSTQGVVSSVLPTQRKIEIGISNDTQTEVISGLEEGEEIVVRTTTSTTKTTTTSSSIKLPGLNGGTRQSGSFSGAMMH